MKLYKNILVAVELDRRTDALVIEQAKSLAKQFGSKLTLVHSVEQIGSYNAYGVGIGLEIENMLVENSNKEIKNLGEKIGVPPKRRIVEIGSAKQVILSEAEKIKADLIVVGSHGRSGMGVILGSTANAVLHGAKCDVLAVRLKG